MCTFLAATNKKYCYALKCHESQREFYQQILQLCVCFQAKPPELLKIKLFENIYAKLELKYKKNFWIDSYDAIIFRPLTIALIGPTYRILPFNLPL